jgi:hypothetical protein
MPIKIKNGQPHVTPTKTRARGLRVDNHEHQIARIYTILHHFSERFVAIETALARLAANTSPAPAPKRRCGKSPSADTIG